MDLRGSGNVSNVSDDISKVKGGLEQVYKTSSWMLQQCNTETQTPNKQTSLLKPFTYVFKAMLIQGQY